jgi:hypothetical protein
MPVIDAHGAVITINKDRKSLLAMDVEEAAHRAAANGGLLMEFDFQPMFYDEDGKDSADAPNLPRQHWRLELVRVQ